MGDVYIHAPRPTVRKCQRRECPVCHKRSVILSWFYEWYGASSTCLRCGDKWADGELMPRPFARGWRQRNIEEAKRTWRRVAVATEAAP